MNRWTGRRDMTEKLLKTALNPNQQQLSHSWIIFLKRLTLLQQQATTTFLLLPPVDIALNDESVNFIKEDLPSDDTLVCKSGADGINEVVYHPYLFDQSTIDDLI